MPSGSSPARVVGLLDECAGAPRGNDLLDESVSGLHLVGLDRPYFYLLRDGLRPVVERELKSKVGDRWLEVAGSKLRPWQREALPKQNRDIQALSSSRMRPVERLLQADVWPIPARTPGRSAGMAKRVGPPRGVFNGRHLSSYPKSVPRRAAGARTYCADDVAWHSRQFANLGFIVSPPAKD